MLSLTLCYVIFIESYTCSENLSATSMENDSNRYLLNYASVSSIKLINKMMTITAGNKIQHIN